MDNNIISKILADYPDAWKDAKRFKALLLDFLPEDKRLRNLIVISVEERIPDDIFQSKSEDALQENAYVKRLVNAVGCSNDDARVVVNLWIVARSSQVFENHSSKLFSVGFPAYDELTEWQLSIVNLPLDKNYVIKGAHGTGKTTVAIYRVLQASRDKKVLYLVSNRSGLFKVQKIINSLGSIGNNVEVKTYVSWITDLINADKISTARFKAYDLDWQEIEKQSMELAPESVPFIVADDAEKMPIELFRIICRVSKNTTCMITPTDESCGQLSVVDAIINLCVEAPYTLTQNLRNTKEIIEVAKLYTSKYLPDSTRQSGHKPIMIEAQLTDQCQCIAQIIRRNLEKRIGVIVQEKSLSAIWSRLNDLVGDECELFTLTKEKMGEPGVTMCSIFSSAGMDFELVILPMFDKLSFGSEGETREIIYELICKAKHELYILYGSDKLNTSGFTPMTPLVKFRQLCEWSFYGENKEENSLDVPTIDDEIGPVSRFSTK